MNVSPRVVICNQQIIMQKIRDKIIDGVKETLGNIKDGKRLVELELENQMLRQENKKLKGMLDDIMENT